MTLSSSPSAAVSCFTRWVKWPLSGSKYWPSECSMRSLAKFGMGLQLLAECTEQPIGLAFDELAVERRRSPPQCQHADLESFEGKLVASLTLGIFPKFGNRIAIFDGEFQRQRRTADQSSRCPSPIGPKCSTCRVSSANGSWIGAGMNTRLLTRSMAAWAGHGQPAT